VRASPVPLLSIVEGVRHAAPDAADEAFVHERYTRELVPGHFREETRREFAALIERMARERRLDAVILAGTELPLLMREARGIAVPLLDSARLHADEAVSRMLA
jgi:aspartate racemase